LTQKELQAPLKSELRLFLARKCSGRLIADKPNALNNANAFDVIWDALTAGTFYTFLAPTHLTRGQKVDRSTR
jgi:hypothetical protein